LDLLTYEEKTKKVLEKFKMLFGDYAKNLSTSYGSLSQSATEYLFMSQSNIEESKAKDQGLFR